MALSDFHVGDPILRSPECEIHWDGWIGTTWRMQRSGWEFAIERDARMDEPTLIFRHRKWGWTGMARTHDGHALYRAMDVRHREAAPAFYAVAMKTDSQIHVLHHTGLMDFVRVDMEPVMEFGKQVSLRSLGVFREWQDPQEIIVEPATVAGLLEQIKQLQAPELARIRDENRKRERRQSSHREITCAQIITLEAA